MSPVLRPIDRRGFAARRRVRDILGRLLEQGAMPPSEFRAALAELTATRTLAAAQLLRLFSEGRVADEVAGLEILGRLAAVEQAPALAKVANDRSKPAAARVVAALALLGLDLGDAIVSPDVSGLVLRWQARHVVEEPTLRAPLMRLYERADREERVAWAALQDRELTEPEGRAAVLEMLAEVETDPELRAAIVVAIARVPAPESRAALDRLAPHDEAERFLLAGARGRLDAPLAAPAPPGWSARVGCADAAGALTLRFDYAPAGRPRRAVLFEMTLGAGLRDALGLVGSAVAHYDELDEGDEPPCAAPTAPAPVPWAMALLREARAADKRAGRNPIADELRAVRLLDPLFDVASAPAPAPRFADDAAPEADVADHAFYAGWSYDASERRLDPLRLQVLRDGRTQLPLDDPLVERAARALARAGEPRRLARLLEHNAAVHAAAGDEEAARAAAAAAAAIKTGRFADLPLVRRMARRGLHPGHYFFAPPPRAAERADVAALLTSVRPPTKLRALAVDLALILERAIDVWQSRIPPHERPRVDVAQRGAIGLGAAGARDIARAFVRRAGREACAAWSADLDARLEEHYVRVLDRIAFPVPACDERRRGLVRLLLAASRALVERTCLGPCREHCPTEPKAPGKRALHAGVFPGGHDAEAFIRTWPGPYATEPNAEERLLLARFLHPPRRDGAAARAPFTCGVCGETRPASARARDRLVGHDQAEPIPVCRRCRDKYHRDPAFRAETLVRLGPLL